MSRFSTVLVVGCGPSVERLQLPPSRPRDFGVVACNRAIELVAADAWVTVDRVHYERSKTHPNARRATRVFVGTARHEPDTDSVLFAPTDVLPGGDGELLLAGGTLTAAAHFAARLGPQRILFVGCDAWDESRDRYREWDGTPLDAAGRAVHREHLARTAAGIRNLAAFYRDVAFLDATDAPRHLDLPPGEWSARSGDGASAIVRDVAVPRGYGRLVAVSSDADHAHLWFEDTCGDVRVVRVQFGPDGLFPFIARS